MPDSIIYMWSVFVWKPEHRIHPVEVKEMKAFGDWTPFFGGEGGEGDEMVDQL